MFEVGDRVKSLKNDASHGCTGIVVARHSHIIDSLAVDFPSGSFSSQWDCDGIIPSKTGWFIRDSELELVVPVRQLKEPLFSLEEILSGLEMAAGEF